MRPEGSISRASTTSAEPFLRTYGRAFLRPRTTFDALARDANNVRSGTLAVAVTATLYTFVYFFLAHNGGRPTVFRPWLAIPAEAYYGWNLYLCAPSIALAWVSAAGFGHLTARALGGTGSFEATLGTLGFALSVSTWWTGLHDLVTTGLGFAGVLDQRAYEDAMSGVTAAAALIDTLMLGYLVSFVVTFTKAMGAVHCLRLARASGAGVVAFVVYQLVFVIFNR